jgi:allantoicase
MDVYPDGGMARLRLFGVPSAVELGEIAARWFNLLPESQAKEVLADLSPADVQRLTDGRPLRATDLPPSLWSR